MISLKTLANVLVFLNASAILVFLISIGVFKSPEEAYLQEYIESRQFNTKEVALEVLNQLDSYVEVPQQYYSSPLKYGQMRMRLTPDPVYCEKVHKLVVEEPEIYYNQMNFMTKDLAHLFMRRVIIPLAGRDFTDLRIPLENSTGSYMDPRITIYYLSFEMHLFHRLGKEMGCLFQEYSQVLGILILNKKDLVASAATNYTYKYRDRPQCFDGNKFFPRTLALDNATQCREWFNYINTKEYAAEKQNRTIVFIRKLTTFHQGKGVQPVDEDEEKALIKEYGNGELCGHINKSVIIQRYIHNPCRGLG